MENHTNPTTHCAIDIRFWNPIRIEKYLASLISIIMKYVRIEKIKIKAHEKSYKPNNQHIVQRLIFGFGILFNDSETEKKVK